MAIQDEILRQLADIQRSLGETVASFQAIREDLRTQTDETAEHRERVNSLLANTAQRLGSLEGDVKELKFVVEKTVKPLAETHLNWQQRAIGFAAAFSMVGLVVGGLYWLATNIGPAIWKAVTKQ